MLVDTSRSNGFFVAYSGGLVFGVDGRAFDPVALTMQTPLIVDAMPYFASARMAWHSSATTASCC